MALEIALNIRGAEGQLNHTKDDVRAQTTARGALNRIIAQIKIGSFDETDKRHLQAAITFLKRKTTADLKKLCGEVEELIKPEPKIEDELRVARARVRALEDKLADAHYGGASGGARGGGP